MFVFLQDEWDGDSNSDFENDNDNDGEDGAFVIDGVHHVANDDDEWETASDASDIDAENTDIQQQLADQMSPLEDIIQRSLSALNQNQQQQTPNSETTPPVGVAETTNVLPIAANETPSSSAAGVSGGGADHVIGMNRRTVDFVTALDRQFFLPLNNAADADGGSGNQADMEDESMSTELKSPTEPGRW